MCFAAREGATNVIATADPEKIRCLRILPPAISERPAILTFLPIPKTFRMIADTSQTKMASDLSMAARVGAFLSNGHPLSQPCSVDARWKSAASQNSGRFQVPTRRNVDKRPSPDFVKDVRT